MDTFMRFLPALGDWKVRVSLKVKPQLNTRVAIPFGAANPDARVCSPEGDCNPKQQESHPVNPLQAQNIILSYAHLPEVIHGVTHSVTSLPGQKP